MTSKHIPHTLIAFLFLFNATILSGCGTQPEPIAIGETPTLADTTQIVTTATPVHTTVPPSATSTATITPSPTQTPSPTPSPTAVQGRYEVGPGDTLLSIAIRYNLELEALLEMNNLSATDTIGIGRVLRVPSAISITLPPIDLVPDSEVVYGESYLNWSTETFIASRGGYLAQYREGERTSAEIIEKVATQYHVGPRVLLATIEMMSGWVSRPEPTSLSPFGMPAGSSPNLSWQAAWAAGKLMEGYYGQLEGRQDWVTLNNGAPARLFAGTSPGTAAIANLLAAIEPASTLPELLESENFQQTYQRLFGDIQGGPVLPPDRKQPPLTLPFPEDELWYFTGGPHGGYGDRISGWAALDFAPPVARGCWPSRYPVRSSAPGLVIESTDGAAWIDLDFDGDIRTGWVILYLHLAEEGRVISGTRVDTGDSLGYPSCEGGISSASHLHMARMYNRQWMPAHGPIPFQIGDWTAEAIIGSAYDGKLTSERGYTLTACDCRSARRNRFPEKPYYSGR